MALGDIGRWMLAGAAVLALLGLVLVVADRIGLGRLPGDLILEGERWRVYIPVGTAVVLSIVATIVLNILLRR